MSNNMIRGFSRGQILLGYRFGLKYAVNLVEDVPDELLHRSFGVGLENHPGFTLGHLTIAAALTAKYLGGPYNVPQGWDDLFRRTGPGDLRLPASDGSSLPPKDSLITELTRQHEIVEQRIRQLEYDHFEKPLKWRFDQHFPTLSDMLTFMCITHEAMHLGQVAAWRRAGGFESSLARL